MNKTVLVTISFVLLLACKKSDVSVPTNKKHDLVLYTGSLRATMNDSLWIASCEGSYDSTLSFGGETFKDGVHIENVLVFSRLSRSLGLQELQRHDGSKPQPYDEDSSVRFLTAEPHGNWDVGGDVYDLLNSDSSANFLNITQLTKHDSEISGVFGVTMVRTDKAKRFPISRYASIQKWKLYADDSQIGY